MGWYRVFMHSLLRSAFFVVGGYKMTISIFKFLSRYYGVSLNAATVCTHLDAKQNFSFIETCSIAFANDNKELVDKGKIVYVKDTSGVVRPYFSPSKTITSECDYTVLKEESSIDDKVLFEELSAIPTYKVCELLSRYKKNRTFYRLIKNELIGRGIYKNKIHKINKEIDSLKESGEDDKYKRRRKIKCKKP